MSSRWARFWNAGTWWKALLFIAAYWGVYQLIALGVSAAAGNAIGTENPLASPLGVVVGMALPILLAGALLLVFARTVGWFGALFARQPSDGRAWMWVAVALVVIPIVLRLAATQWSAWSFALVLSLLFLGLCVGFTEEVATRGIVVQMLRRGGTRERAVFVLSSAYFALLHAGNIFQGQAGATVLLTVVYTFGFGAMMYLVLRVTGRLMWAILLHAATDPTTILATGGIDAHSAELGGSADLLGIAGIFNVVYLLFAVVAIFLVKSRGSSERDVAQSTS
ncbi:CPBP family intramembrane metalloprotease [Leucobacter sp. USCH14]|uniref:CPBP family intramembrane glutamic endopeptidase n=1 Tax=Leucobacter sp. USCH14 TaxID=3024838 RepID=UPI0030A57A92